MAIKQIFSTLIIASLLQSCVTMRLNQSGKKPTEQELKQMNWELAGFYLLMIVCVDGGIPDSDLRWDHHSCNNRFDLKDK